MKNVLKKLNNIIQNFWFWTITIPSLFGAGIVNINWIHANLFGLSFIGIAIILTCWRAFVFLKQRKQKKNDISTNNFIVLPSEKEFISLIDASTYLNTEGTEKIEYSKWKHYLEDTPHYQYGKDLFNVMKEEETRDSIVNGYPLPNNVEKLLYRLMIACKNNELDLWGENPSSKQKLKIQSNKIKNFSYDFIKIQNELYGNFCFKKSDFVNWCKKALDDITHSSK